MVIGNARVCKYISFLFPDGNNFQSSYFVIKSIVCLH